MTEKRQSNFRPALSVMLAALLPLHTGADDFGAEYFHDRQRLEVLLESGDSREAYELVRSLNAQNPADSFQWWQQGNLAARLGLWPESAAAFEESMRLGSAFEAVTARRIAEAHARTGNRDAAIDWLQKSVALGLDRRFELPDQDAFAALREDDEFLALAGLATDVVDDREERWVRDIDALVYEAQRMHRGPGRPAYSASFLDAVERLKRDVPDLDDLQVTLGLQRLVAMLGDGHSYVWVGFIHEKAAHPPTLENAGSLPLVFHAFGEDVYVINGTDAGASLIGSKVLAFGDVSTTEFVEAARRYLHGDNAESWKFLGVHFGFRGLGLHRELGTAAAGGVELTVEFPGGRRERKRLTGGDYQFPRKLRPMPGQQEVPLFLEEVDTVYRTVSMPERNALYLQVNNIRNAEGRETLAEFAENAISAALESSTHNVIVDFRLNNGGNNFLCEGLLQALLRFRFADEQNRIFVITRHETFSAAQNCSNRIEANTDAIFVGEPSSSSPNFVGEETQVLLPYSGTIVSISNLYWQDSQPWDNRPWIAPDIPATLTFDEYANGRDPALASIFEVIGSTDP